MPYRLGSIREGEDDTADLSRVRKDRAAPARGPGNRYQGIELRARRWQPVLGSRAGQVRCVRNTLLAGDDVPHDRRCSTEAGRSTQERAGRQPRDPTSVSDLEVFE